MPADMPPVMPETPPGANPAPAATTTLKPPPSPDTDPKKIEEMFKARVEAAVRRRRMRHTEWRRNIEVRIGLSGLGAHRGAAVIGSSDAQTELNPDWALTKTKTANLYSQVPTVQGTHENNAYAAAVPLFMKSLNYEIGEKRAHIGTAMEECLNDVVNAAGVAAVHIGYAARFDYPEVPAIDTSHIPPVLLQTLLAAKRIPMKRVPRVVSDKFFGNRVSPSDLLTPVEFVGSNFDDGDWVGHTARTSWAEAVNEFKLRDEDKEKVIAAGVKNTQDDLRTDPEGREQGSLAEALHVTYDEIFYWRYKVDPAELSFNAIWRIVYVEGMKDAVIHEPWKGQQYNPQTRKYVGACRFPIQVLTLTYITDNPLPPSDSSAGRPQVNDLRRSRSQMFQNRERSVPLRWFDVNRVDPLIQESLMHGTWQAMIPTNGDGTRVIGEIARASYPSEDMTFDEATKQDLMETWQVGPNQLGATQPGRRTAGEASITQQNFSTRMGQERARVASFFLRICDVMAGLMVLYSDFPVLTPEERQIMKQAWDEKAILHDLVLKIRPDTQVVMDVSQQLERTFTFINMTAKSGYVKIKPLLIHALNISGIEGIDPNEVIVDPEPPPPSEPNISYRFSGKDDLMNPLVVALLMKHKQMPTPEELDQAKQLLEAVGLPASSPQPPASSPGPGGPAGPEGSPEPPPPGPGGPSPGAFEANPDWHLAPKIAQRAEDMGGGA